MNKDHKVAQRLSQIYHKSLQGIQICHNVSIADHTHLDCFSMQHVRLVCLSGGSYFDLHDSVGPLKCYSDLERGVDTKCAHCIIDLIMIK